MWVHVPGPASHGCVTSSQRLDLAAAEDAAQRRMATSSGTATRSARLVSDAFPGVRLAPGQVSRWRLRRRAPGVVTRRRGSKAPRSAAPPAGKAGAGAGRGRPWPHDARRRPLSQAPGPHARWLLSGVLLTWGKRSRTETLKTPITSRRPRQVYKRTGGGAGGLGRNPTPSKQRARRKGALCELSAALPGPPPRSLPPSLLSAARSLGWGCRPPSRAPGRGSELSGLYSQAAQQIVWAEDGKAQGPFSGVSERESPR